MKLKLHLLLIFCLSIAIACNRKPDYHPVKNVGDDAPSLRVKKWLKGKPVEDFEKGKVYVVEFWATWCVPCKAAMPRLSALAKKYKGKVTFIAMDVYENKTGTTVEKVQTVVDQMKDKMAFSVAVEDSNFMARDWIEASGESGIPSTFLIDGDGKVAWIGHPADLDTILPRVLNNTWSIKAALAARNLYAKLNTLDEQTTDKTNKYGGLWNSSKRRRDFGYPDSALWVINSIVKKEPRLKYQPNTAYITFYSMLKANRLSEAWEYGRHAMLANIADKESLYSNLIIAIKYIREEHPQIKITSEIYKLAAECQQKLIDIQPYPELIDRSAKYCKVAEWHRLSGNTIKAKEAEDKALTFL